MILNIGPGGCGFTFLNWTISYLRGDIFYVTLDGKKYLVDDDPLLGATAHNFKKDHLKIENSKEILKFATPWSIVYLTPGSQEDFDYLLSFPGKKILFDTTTEPRELLARSCILMPPTAESIVVCLDRLRERYGESAARQMFLECAKFFIQYYSLPDQTQYSYCKINYDTMFRNLDNKISEIFCYLETSIDTDRFETWKKVYQIYKTRNAGFIEQFLGKDVTPVNTAFKKAIFKEILDWKHGRYHHTKSN